MGILECFMEEVAFRFSLGGWGPEDTLDRRDCVRRQNIRVHSWKDKQFHSTGI